MGTDKGIGGGDGRNAYVFVEMVAAAVADELVGDDMGEGNGKGKGGGEVVIANMV
jgi:hypothetical protein